MDARQACSPIPGGARIAPYYSKTQFASARTGAGPFTYTIAANAEVKPFAYGVNDDMAAAGKSGTTAGISDTGLSTKGRTQQGHNVSVRGLAIAPLPLTEIALLRQAMHEVSVRALIAGNEPINLGLLHMYPGAGGINGAQESNVEAQPLAGGRPMVAIASNGLTGYDNWGHLPEQILWTEDALFWLSLRAERAIAYTGQLADESAAAGTRGYANPTASAVYVELCSSLKGYLNDNPKLTI